jgi:hypothetical protein
MLEAVIPLSWRSLSMALVSLLSVPGPQQPALPAVDFTSAQ